MIFFGLQETEDATDDFVDRDANSGFEDDNASSGTESADTTDSMNDLLGNDDENQEINVTTNTKSSGKQKRDISSIVQQTVNTEKAGKKLKLKLTKKTQIESNSPNNKIKSNSSRKVLRIKKS